MATSCSSKSLTTGLDARGRWLRSPCTDRQGDGVPRNAGRAQQVVVTLPRVRLKDQLFKRGTGIHRAILRVTKGRLLGQLGGMPVVILETTGRRTGKKRSAVLTSPVVDEGRIVLVASYGGDDRHPKWFLNLRDDPDVRVTIAGHPRPMRARVGSEAERAELWPQVVEAYGGYAAYQQRSVRNIPLVILEPTS